MQVTITDVNGTHQFELFRIYPDHAEVKKGDNFTFFFTPDQILHASNEQVEKIVSDARGFLAGAADWKKEDLSEVLTQIEAHRSSLDEALAVFGWLIREASIAHQEVSVAEDKVRETMDILTMTSRLTEAVLKTFRSDDPAPATWTLEFDKALDGSSLIPFPAIRKDEVERLNQEMERIKSSLSKNNRHHRQRLQQLANEVIRRVSEGTLTTPEWRSLFRRMERLSEKIPLDTDRAEVQTLLSRFHDRYAPRVESLERNRPFVVAQKQMDRLGEMRAEMAVSPASALLSLSDVHAGIESLPASSSRDEVLNQIDLLEENLTLQLGSSVVGPRSLFDPEEEQSKRRVFWVRRYDPIEKNGEIPFLTHPSGFSSSDDPVPSGTRSRPTPESARIAGEDEPDQGIGKVASAVSAIVMGILFCAAGFTLLRSVLRDGPAVKTKPRGGWFQIGSLSTESGKGSPPLESDGEGILSGSHSKVEKKSSDQDGRVPVWVKGSEIPLPKIPACEPRDPLSLYEIEEISGSDFLRAGEGPSGESLAEGIEFDGVAPVDLFPLENWIGLSGTSGGKSYLGLLDRSDSGKLELSSEIEKCKKPVSCLHRLDALWVAGENSFQGFIKQGTHLNLACELQIEQSSPPSEESNGFQQKRLPIWVTQSSFIGSFLDGGIRRIEISRSGDDLEAREIWSHSVQKKKGEPSHAVISNLIAVGDCVGGVQENGEFIVLNPENGEVVGTTALPHIYIPDRHFPFVASSGEEVVYVQRRDDEKTFLCQHSIPKNQARNATLIPPTRKIGMFHSLDGFLLFSDSEISLYEDHDLTLRWRFPLMDANAIRWCGDRTHLGFLLEMRQGKRSIHIVGRNSGALLWEINREEAELSDLVGLAVHQGKVLVWGASEKGSAILRLLE